MIESDSIQYGTTIIPYSISYSPRRKNLAIAVYPTKKVEVKAPYKTKPEIIRRLVQKKASWVIKHVEWFNQFEYINVEKEYVNGETFLYLGRQYRLKIIKSHERSVTKLRGRYFEVSVPEHVTEKMRVELVKEALFTWYKSHAEEIIDIAVDKYSKKLGIKTPDTKVKYQLKRWGSCTPSNILNINLQIAMAPMSQIEYVVAHELCHIKYKNHSSDFWQLLRIIMPDYELRKDNLRKEGWRYVL